jgi:hypothetical protein
MRNQGYTITNPQTWIPNADGKFVLQTVSTDELRQQKAQARKDRYYDSLYDERYEPKNKGEGAGKGYYDDPSNWSNSGLKV